MWRLAVEHLRAAFAETDLRRGQRYAREGRVLWMERREHGIDRVLLGEVRGSRRQPYRVHARMLRRDGRWRIESHCSCPVQLACKHAVALLLRASTPVELGPLGPALAEPPGVVAPEEGSLGALLTGLGPGGHLPGLRPGRWLRGPAGAWRFQELSSLPAAAGGVGIGALQALISACRSKPPNHIDGQRWWMLEEHQVDALLELAAAGRLAWQSPQEMLLAGPERQGRWSWWIDAQGTQRPLLDGGEGSVRLAVAGRWLYVDTLTRQVGPLEPEMPAATAAALLAMPPLSPEQAAAELDGLDHRLPPGFPPPQRLLVETADAARPRPLLTLHQSAAAHEQHGRRSARLVAFARLSFRYGPARVGEADPSERITVYDGELVRVYPRDRGRERELATRLKQLGLISNRHALIDHPGLQQNDWIINSDGDAQSLNEFCYAMLPRLRQEGWRLEYGPRFPLKLVDADYRFYAEVDEDAPRKLLTLELGIEVDGERVNLLPVLREGLRDGRFHDLPSAEDAIVALTLPGERRLPIAAGRLRFILDTLNELGETGSIDQRRLRLPRARAAALLELENELSPERHLWAGSSGLRRLAERLSRFAGMPATPVPRGLRAELRPYQVEGLAWLRFLAEQELSGILADDMGLGKTLQVIAFLLGEQQEGGLERPALVVCPKSVLPNWQAELARFAPCLRVLVHAGPTRGKRVLASAGCDVVLTTYPLLARDVEALAARSWRLLVLDESQMIKNPATLAARAARRLDASMRLCLTGTPLENHLGELWAQFDLLLPGLLGSKADFLRNFRKPIEKGRSQPVHERLRRRIRPFLLRRTKDQVIADLPPKTEVLRSITLEGRQRDLYETLRATHAEEMRNWIASGSFERNRMRALEALLRLRQVCCDPRLLQMPGRAPASAKLDCLMDMLHELIAAGRRILVFSQFTSMLELIEAELEAERVRYVKLTGQTEDRATPVERFQRGEAPVFLISLRAGGFGLNLTRADTVVHYDPWWNPAVESQATDRAHRIGQRKPVFVYRLVASGTVEERILALQASKRELADALLDDSGQSLVASLSPDDWLSLLT